MSSQWFVTSDFSFPSQHADLWVANTNAFTRLSDNWKLILDQEEIRKAAKFKHLESRKVFIISRALLKAAGSKYFKIAPDGLKLDYQKNGKPFFKTHENLHFNISHSGKLIVLLFSSVQCGIDCESFERKLDFATILKRFFNKNERKSFAIHSKNNQAEVFFRGWTRKEAWLKNTGEGIGGLSSCEISFAENSDEALVLKKGAEYADIKWFCSEFLFYEKYICTTVFKDEKPAIHVKDAGLLLA